MKVKGILNNYQIGSYSYNMLSMNVISKKRIDSYHTEVVWELDRSQCRLLSKVVKNLEIIEEDK